MCTILNLCFGFRQNNIHQKEISLQVNIQPAKTPSLTLLGHARLWRLPRKFEKKFSARQEWRVRILQDIRDNPAFI